MNLRSFAVFFAVFLSVCLVPGAGLAVEVLDGPKVQVSGATATVSWRTDVPTGTSVRFGTSEKNLNRKAETEGVDTSHTVSLGGLEPGTTYWFNVGTSKRPLKAGTFTTSGVGPKTTGPSQATPPAPSPEVKPAPKPVPAPVQTPAPPTRQTWGNLPALQDHFVRHGRDFGAKNADDYAAKAWLFLQRAKAEKLPAKLDASDGTIRVWDPKTRAFAAYNRDGTTKTYFKPDSADYFQRQPGKACTLR